MGAGTFAKDSSLMATLRPARAGDLPAVNGVIQRAIGTWRLTPRVKRLAVPLYCYRETDLTALELTVAERAGEVVAVAAWEPAAAQDLPSGQRGLLLHGLYVDPAWQGRGLGRLLLYRACAAAGEAGFDGVLVKAQAEAAAFFAAAGCRLLPVQDPARDYPHRYWCAPAAGCPGG